MFWKKQTSEPTTYPLTLSMHITIQLDNSIPDTELQIEIKRRLKEYFLSNFTLNIARITRDTDGKILALSELSCS